MASKGRQLKELINSPRILVTPGVYDGYSARLTQHFGFKSGSITGAGTSESRLGWADRGVMGLDENVNNARRLVDCCDLLLRADADTGYGNAMSVYFATRAFEKAGCAAVMFEDQVWPKRCGHMAGKRLIATDEMAGKIKAALDARHDADFVVIARCDAIMVNGLQDTLERGEAYLEAGADMLFFEMRESMDEIRAIAGRFRGRVPLHFNHSPSGMVPRLHVSEIERLGFKTACFYVHALMAACKVMREVLTEIKQTGNSVSVWERMVKFDEFWQIAGLDGYRAREKKYGA
jgi:2,3-dimethylmalate lyase